MQAAAPNAYTIKNFCMAYGIGRSLAYEEISRGRLKALKVANRTLILRVDAEQWASSLPSTNGKKVG